MNTKMFFTRRNPKTREKNCVSLTLEGQTFPLCKTHFLQDYSLGIQRRFAILPSLPTSLDLSLLSLSDSPHSSQDYSPGIQQRLAILPSLPTSLDLPLLSLKCLHMKV